MAIETQFPQLTAATGGLTGLGALALLAARWMWRRWSRDAVELAKDRAETNVLGTLQEQLAAANKRADEMAQRADQFARERNESVGELHALRREVELLRRQVQRQGGLLSRLVEALLQIDRFDEVANAAGINASDLAAVYMKPHEDAA